jgi:ribosomal protein S18 acetylase RimI-like enzyme
MIEYIKPILRNYISEYDNNFIVQDLDNYLDKVQKNAIMQVYLEEGQLVGFIFYYANDIEGDAFLTLVFVDPASKGKRIGKRLLESSINDIKEKSFKNYRLEVKKSNKGAIRLYESCGFVQEKDLGEKLIMNLNLS